MIEEETTVLKKWYERVLATVKGTNGDQVF